MYMIKNFGYNLILVKKILNKYEVKPLEYYYYDKKER